MAKFCTHCGKELADGATFCTECGAKTNEPSPAPQQQYTQYAPQPEQRPQGGKYGVASTASFFWLMLLFSLPFIGWIFCIVFAFAPQNENIKHYARAILLWVVVGIVAVLLLSIFASGFLASVLNGMGGAYL